MRIVCPIIKVHAAPVDFWPHETLPRNSHAYTRAPLGDVDAQKMQPSLHYYTQTNTVWNCILRRLIHASQPRHTHTHQYTRTQTLCACTHAQNTCFACVFVCVRARVRACVCVRVCVCCMKRGCEFVTECRDHVLKNSLHRWTTSTTCEHTHREEPTKTERHIDTVSKAHTGNDI